MTTLTTQFGMFKIIQVKGDGNCLFYTMRHFLDPMKKNPELANISMREQLSGWYDNFEVVSMLETYSDDSIQASIRLMIMCDMVEAQDEGEEYHSTLVKENFVWGNITDIYMFALYCNLEIHLIVLCDDKRKHVTTIRHPDATRTIHILHATCNGFDHFRPLEPLFD